MLISSNPIMTAIRSIFVVTDVGIYALLRFMYELFFNIATFNVVDREMIFNIISRVQLIVGVYMMFQLILIIIRGIINPDSFTDSKTGAGNLIMRIIVSLSLLALIVPINIPSPKNEYEKQINNSGILFGTLYSLQYRILTNNTLGRIILGQEGTNYTSSNPDGQYLVTFGNRFVSVIAKSFYSIYRDESGDSVCDDKWVDEYNKEDIWPEEVIVLGLKHCKGKYFLNMTMLISSVAGIVLVVIMFMMCFEVAKRVFQLAALQLLAPIPIISYMDPKGSKDGAFSSWVKLLGKTYLDLFMRLTVIYFTLAVIEGFINKFFSNMVESNLNTWQGDTLAAYELNRWTFIILCIALFIFAKDAPKFFKQMLGLKGDGKFFSAFGQAMGLGVAAAGAVGSARTGYKTAAEENAKLHPNENNKMRNLGAGLISGLGGGYAGVKAAMNDKGGGVAAVMDAQRKHRADRAAHRTFLRGLKDDMLSTATGESPAEAGKKRLTFHKAFQDAQKNWKSALETEAINNGTACDLGDGVIGTYRDLMAALENPVERNGVKYVELGGRHYKADRFTPTYKEEALKAQVLSYQQNNTKAGGTTYQQNIHVGGKLYINYEALKKSRDDVGSYVIDDPNITDAERQTLTKNFNDTKHGGKYDIDNVYTYGKALGASNAAMSAEQNSMRNIINNANTKENKK